MSRRILAARIVTAGVVSALIGAGSVTSAHAEMATGPEHHDAGLVPSGATILPNTAGLTSTGGRMRAFSATTPGALPDAVSLEQYDVPVGNQGMVNSCVTWAIGYSMLGWYSRRSGSTATFAPMYIYSQDHYPDDGGSTSNDAYGILTTQGITPQSIYSHGDYDGVTLPTDDDRAAAAAHTTTAPHYLFEGDGSTPPGAAGRTAIETAIAAQHPVAIAIPIFDQFDGLTASHSELRASDIPANAVDSGGHEVLVVGYDSTGVRIQNQWGTSWGDDGYATLDWAFVEQYALEASWIYGFSSSLPATAPAQVDAFTSRVSTFGTSSASVSAAWRGAAEYDDSVRHPVTGYVSTLTGSDGTTRTVTNAAASRSVSFPVAYDTTYTLSVSARNAIGTGPTQTFTFRPSTFGANARYVAPTVAGAVLPSPPMPAAAPLPSPPSPSPTSTASTISVPSVPGTPTTAPSVPVPSTPAPAPDATSMPSPAPLPAASPSAPGVRSPKFGTTAVSVRWTAPTRTGDRALEHYRVTVVAARARKTVYSRTWLVPASQHSLRIPFATSAHHGERYLQRGLTCLVIVVRAENTAGRWSGARASTTTVSRTHAGLRYRTRMQ